MRCRTLGWQSRLSDISALFDEDRPLRAHVIRVVVIRLCITDVVVVGVADDYRMVDVVVGGVGLMRLMLLLLMLLLLLAIRGKGDGGRGVVDVGGARVHGEGGRLGPRGRGTTTAGHTLRATWTDAPLGPR